MRYSDDELRRTAHKSIKWLQRYGEVDIDPDALKQLMFYALKGIDCEIDHIGICEKRSIIKHFKDIDVEDPYLKKLIKKCEV